MITPADRNRLPLAYVLLVLIAVVLTGLICLKSLGAAARLGGSACLVVFTWYWLKRFGPLTLQPFRWVALAIISLQLVFLIPVSLLALLFMGQAARYTRDAQVMFAPYDGADLHGLLKQDFGISIPNGVKLRGKSDGSCPVLLGCRVISQTFWLTGDPSIIKNLRENLEFAIKQGRPGTSWKSQIDHNVYIREVKLNPLMSGEPTTKGDRITLTYGAQSRTFFFGEGGKAAYFNFYYSD